MTDTPISQPDPTGPVSEGVTQAEIDAANRYWRDKAMYQGRELFVLPGGFFWCELLAAVDAARLASPINSAPEQIAESANCSPADDGDRAGEG